MVKHYFRNTLSTMETIDKNMLALRTKMTVFNQQSWHFLDNIMYAYWTLPTNSVLQNIQCHLNRFFLPSLWFLHLEWIHYFTFSLPNRYFLDSKEEGVRYFRIDENSGLIRTTQSLDREDMSWHNITVMASEVGKYPGFFPLTQCLQVGEGT